ncbi:MAG TPA: YIP1 family protein [Polyangia bacterium]|nr:YIP1 family protein [Polyangia bacterium]
MRDSLIARVRGLLLKPKEELPKTIAEAGDFKSLLPYVLVLLSIGALARFVSGGIIGRYVAPQVVFGMKIGGGWFRAPVTSLVGAVLSVAFGVGVWWFFGFILNVLAPSFGARKDEAAANKIAAWIATPIWVAGGLAILGSVPYLDWLATLGGLGGLVYGVMIGIWGLPLLMGTPEPKAPGHVLASMGITLAVAAVVGFVIFGLIIGSVFAAGAALPH